MAWVGPTRWSLAFPIAAALARGGNRCTSRFMSRSTRAPRRGNAASVAVAVVSGPVSVATSPIVGAPPVASGPLNAPLRIGPPDPRPPDRAAVDRVRPVLAGHRLVAEPDPPPDGLRRGE